MAVANKPHVVCIPSPYQSHIKATLKLAKLLHHKGFHVTFVNTEFNHRRLLKSRGRNSLDGSTDFRFRTIPDGLPPSGDSTNDLRTVCKSIRENLLAPFRNLLAELNNSASSNIPPVTSIVSDGFMTFTITAAEEFGLPVVLLWTLAACGFMGFYQFRSLVDRGLAPLKDPSYLTNGYLDTPVNWIPGMKNMRLKDLPSLFRTTDPDDIAFNFAMEAAERAPKASAIVLHTFDALEPLVLGALSSIFPRVYTIGPLQLLLNQIPEEEEHLSSIGYSLWKEEPQCLQWLNSKEPNSVIYVNFGSVVVMKPQELIEFGWGLANSNHNFLWIIRSDLVVGETAVFKPEFLEEIKERGFISDPSYLTNGYLDTPVNWIPGMKNMRLKDLPSLFRTTDPDDIAFNFAMEAAERAPKASAIVLHTFDALEPLVLGALSSIFPRVYTIGPLQLLLNQIPEEEEHLSSIGYSLWKEEPQCLQWLNSKEPNSVIYVNFGSVVVMKPQELIEFGWGLANSNHNFLWIIRSDLVVGETAVFKPEFLEEIKERGFISGWCPQEQVLNHPSIGGFLTHSGWNSIIESLSAGVPMICWPVDGEQQTNCLYACTEWGIGMEIDGDVRREKVERVVRELMDGEEGKKMKKKASEWKRMADEATSPNGSSSLNLDKLVNEVLLSKR